ncbi:probable phospholipid hydroperoxide glutathione peroxidase [Contarinia nasturtii]|uniref:probable phospholipid hydroperoxide glutathione peroxidase n=1 Tax=Contarinia nasturtii TaxID=265458 RepID=UPI0012D43F9A|nr:probable phospholipid hydroperoxide glutathione peroxidase [Contarinia nasturtii]
MFWLILSVCLLSNTALAANVGDLNPSTDCKTLLAEKSSEREKNPDLANQLTANDGMDFTKAASIYDFTPKDTFLNDIALGDLCSGFVTIIVNIASGCGFTPVNYEQLTQLNKDYSDRLRILAFPCNQFASTMPEGDGDEMLCHLKERNADIGTIFAKVNVNGVSAIPLYKYLEGQMSGVNGSDVEWNFAKFLIDKRGKVVKRYEPTTEPMEMLDDIKALF